MLKCPLLAVPKLSCYCVTDFLKREMVSIQPFHDSCGQREGDCSSDGRLSSRFWFEISTDQLEPGNYDMDPHGLVTVSIMVGWMGGWVGHRVSVSLSIYNRL